MIMMCGKPPPCKLLSNPNRGMWKQLMPESLMILLSNAAIFRRKTSYIINYATGSALKASCLYLIY